MRKPRDLHIEGRIFLYTYDGGLADQGVGVSQNIGYILPGEIPKITAWLRRAEKWAKRPSHGTKKARKR